MLAVLLTLVNTYYLPTATIMFSVDNLPVPGAKGTQDESG